MLYLVRRSLNLISLCIAIAWLNPALALDLEPDFRKPEQFGGEAKLESLQNQRSGDWQRDLHLGAPIYRTDEDVFSLTLNGHDVHLPVASGRPTLLSERLLGASYYHHRDHENIQGIMVSVGSASDRPFTGDDTNVLSVTGLVRYPSKTPHRSWVLMLNLSNDRPAFQTTLLPGFAYVLSNPEATTITVIGFPFVHFQSRVMRRTRVIGTALPWAFNGQIEYSFFDNLKGFLHASWMPRAYFQHGRSDLRERMFYEEKQVDMGARLHFMPNSFGAISVGYNFDRSYFVGQSLYHIDGGRNEIADSAFAKLILQIGI